jgi:hypothetical protein
MNIEPEQMIFMDEVPNPESIRRWGYDTSLFFEDIDEDLLLGSEIANYSSLLELASDPSCPKADYALSIVSFQVDFHVLYRRVDECLKLRELVSTTPGLAGIALDWWREFDPLIDRLLMPRRFTPDQAQTFARRLLVGAHKKLTFKVEKKVLGHHAFSAGKSYLYIMPDNGMWTFSRYQPLKSIPPY